MLRNVVRSRTSEPVVSVIVPVYNDPEGIRITLDSLLTQTYPTEEYEVLAVDNGSTDGTRDVIRGFADTHDHVHLLVEDEVQGSYAARNHGIRDASGSVCAFLDADVTVEPDHIARGVETLEERNVDYLACNVRLYPPEERTLAGAYDERFAFPVERYFEKWNYGPTCGLFVRRSVFEEVGRFDERLVSGGDAEFGDRVHRAGRPQAFACDLVVYHPVRSSVRALVGKNLRIGRGTYQRRYHHPDRYGSPRSALPSPSEVLPPRPWTIAARCRGWNELPVRTRIAFYLLAYLLKLATTGGLVKEALAIHR